MCIRWGVRVLLFHVVRLPRNYMSNFVYVVLSVWGVPFDVPPQAAKYLGPALLCAELCDPQKYVAQVSLGCA